MSQWQLELKNLVRTYEELFKLIKLKKHSFPQKLREQLKINNFPLLITRSYIDRITPANPRDPLLLQILPNLPASSALVKNYTEDPLNETEFNPIPGLIHKYSGRVLILSNKSCAIHCQYCFRRNFNYNQNIASGSNLKAIISYISADPSITEVILSGGDPLLAPDLYFKKLFDLLDPISHINTIRIHSRIPIVLPTRLDSSLIKILTQHRFKLILVTHCNHPNEINHEVSKQISKLHKTKIMLLNQAVLLKNINDDAKILAKLSQKLFDLRILPYYLHTLDKVNGAENFEVSLPHIKKIFSKLISILPGYLVPKLVTEKPGAKSKILFNLDV